MRAEARWLRRDKEAEAAGQGSLFDSADVGAGVHDQSHTKAVKYEYEPPWLPIGQTEAGE